MTIVAGGTEILVSTRNAGTQATPQITALADGGFAVTWASRVDSGDWEVRCRVFAADGTPVLRLCISQRDDPPDYHVATTPLPHGRNLWHEIGD
jgi:hypothetical protein